jgi:UDP-N-acetylmuramate: L-alanyl-gamma-D-glutamyl-meso-diaminopimelate ligase
VFAGGVSCGRFAFPLSGLHNVANAIAALAACAQGYGVKLEALVRPLASFGGVKRRQELLGSPGGIYVYDDFAHHPTAVKKTLAGFRARHRGARLIVLFEPRSATACRKLHQRQYVEALAAADCILLAPLGRSGLAQNERLDTLKLASDLNGTHRQAQAHTDIDSMVDWVVQRARPGDVIAVLSNGAFGQIHQKLLDGLGARYSP